MKKQKSIALVAHDNRKKDLIEWVRFNKDKLRVREHTADELSHYSKRTVEHWDTGQSTTSRHYCNCKAQGWSENKCNSKTY